MHGRVPRGADPHGNIKDEGLVDGLRRRQGRRLAEGGDPHSKLPRLLDLQPTTGRNWYRPDMTAEHHAATAKEWLMRALLSFRQETAARGRAGSRAAFDALAARGKQRWLFVEPCMRDPLMVTPLDHGTHPHFKLPQAQGRALQRYVNAVGWLEQTEARHTGGRRQRDGLDSDEVQAVRKTLDDLLTEVAAGSELLYDGPPASSLDGQPLAIAIKAHLARPDPCRDGVALRTARCCGTVPGTRRVHAARTRRRSQRAVDGGAGGNGAVAELLACNA